MNILVFVLLVVGQYDFTIARVQYGGGGDWYSDPSSLTNLLAAVNERTNIRAAPREAVVKITDPELFEHPYLYMTGHGNIHFTDDEVKILRTYFAAGRSGARS